MTSLPVLSIDARRALVDMLELPQAHAEWLVDAFGHLPEGACYRALLLQDTRRRVRQRFGDEAADGFQAFWRRVDIPGPFAFMPVETYLVVCLARGRLHIPDGTHPFQALYDSQRLFAEDFARDNPLVTTAFRAAAGDLAEFWRIQATLSERWQNFGSIDIEQHTSTHLCVYYTDYPFDVLAPGIHAFMDGTRYLFEHIDRLEIEQLSDTSFCAHLHTS